MTDLVLASSSVSGSLSLAAPTVSASLVTEFTVTSVTIEAHSLASAVLGAFCFGC